MEVSAPNPQLVELLRSYALRKVPYETATDALLQAGWSQAEITDAYEEIPYDIIRAGDDIDDTAPSPEDAADQAMGEAALQDQRDNAAQQAALDGMASRYNNEFLGKYLDDLGISWTMWFGGQIAIAAAVVLLGWPTWIINVLIGVLIVSLTAYGFSRYRQPKSRK